MLNKIKYSDQHGHSHIILPIVCVLLIAVVGARVLLFKSHALTASNSNCTVSAILVNSCRPWIGAAVTGDPSAPAADKISQFKYLETLVGHPLDVFHDYHPVGNLPLNSDETYFANRANTYDYINWKPGPTWKSAMAVSQGGSQAVNNQIRQVANNIKSLNHKVFLTVWHEPENDASAFDNTTQKNACASSPSFIDFKGSAGSPDQYIGMWQNVENIFKAQGVNNVVWTMNYMGYKNWDCLIPYMWPGNNLVDWVTMDSYGSSSNPTWDNSVGRIYNVIKADNGMTVNNEKIDFVSKPWGAAEFGDCNPTTDSQIVNYFTSIKTAIDNNSYPLLKMYMVYDDTGNNAGPGCLVDHNASGQPDAAKLAAFIKFANDPIFKGSTPSTQPAITSFSASPSGVTVGSTSTLSWSTSNTTSCSLNPGGPQSTKATTWITPKLSTAGSSSYTLSCQGGGASVSKSVTVVVSSGPGNGGGNASGTIVGIASKCLDNQGNKKVDYNKVQLFTCNATGAQKWNVASSGAIVNNDGYCLDVYHDKTAVGTDVDLFQCNGTPAQLWKVNASAHTIVNPHSGLCLNVQASATADGTQVQMNTCNGSAGEVWHV